MGRPGTALLLLFALLWAACRGNGGAGGPSGGDSFTGPLTEEEFKALHELGSAERPPAKGTAVEVAGARAYLSLPEGAGPHPGVVVIHEWWGLNDHIRHWADRLAAAGYAALAPDLYGGEVATTPDRANELRKAVDDARALEVLKASHAFLAADPRVRAARRASIGWCFGGHWSLRLAMEAPDLDACVVYYGRPVTDPERLRAIGAAVLGVFGTQDPSIPNETVDELERALEEAGVTHTILRYDAQHAFANPSSARYDEPAATEAWRRTREFLDRRLR
jgi:carboxymethylenebutenolidase